MSFFKRKIDRFAARHPYFGIPNLIKYITIANCVFWAISLVDRSGSFISLMYFSPYHIIRGQVWRLFSFMLIPPSTGYLALIAFYFYYWIGSILETNWGTCRFNIFFFSGVILTVIYGFILFFITGTSYTVSSTYIYLSMFLAFAAIFPNMQVLLFFILPIKIKYLAYVDLFIFALGIIQNPFPANILPIVAILNFIIFCGADLLPSGIRRKRNNVVNFKKQMREANREANSKSYSRKCSVCGRTDVDSSNLQFRYCSRCVGYHCFCEEHINNHIHFTE